MGKWWRAKYKGYHFFILALFITVIILLVISWYKAGNLASAGEENDILEARLVRRLTSVHSAEKESAQEATIKAVLEMTGHSDWYELQPLSTQFLTADLIPAGGQELIVGISLLPDHGMVAIFKRINNEYRLASTLYFVNVDQLEVINIPDIKLPVLAIKENYNERLGAFYESKTEYLYAWDTDLKKMRDIFSVVTFEQSYWNEQWDRPEKPPRWLGEMTKRKYNIDQGGNIVVIGEIQELKSLQQTLILPPIQEFEVVNIKETKETYIWNAKNFKYVKKIA